jgi:hypothetical protein
MSQRDWMPDEDAVLRRMAADHSAAEIGAVLHRTSRSVEHRARRIRVAVFKPNSRWQPHEDAILREAHETHTVKQMAGLLDNRGYGAIHHRLGLLGLTCKTPEKGRRWTAEEDQMIREGLSAREIERRTGRTAKAIRMRRSVMTGFVPRSRVVIEDGEVERVPTFTPADELDLLRQEYPGQSYRNYRIPSEGVSARRYSVPLDYSPTGSSAAMCAGAL